MTKQDSPSSRKGPGQGSDLNRSAPTVSQFLGEMTWLLTQSPLHRTLTLSDLDWLIMPPLLREQFYIFRDNEKPIGLAIWAFCSREVVGKIERGLTEPNNQLTLADWKSGEELWLIDLIAPFATEQNQQLELMMADLISKPLSGKRFSFHRVDPATGLKELRTVDEQASDRLTRVIEGLVR